MKQALFVVSGVAIGLLASLVAVLSTRTDFMPRAEAQAGPAAGGAGGVTVMGTGGGSNNQNDLCWVLSRVKPARGPERTVLALYRAERGGELFNLKDVRFIDADLRHLDLDKKHEPTVSAVMKALPQEEQDSLRPPPRNP